MEDLGGRRVLGVSALMTVFSVIRGYAGPSANHISRLLAGNPTYTQLRILFTMGLIGMGAVYSGAIWVGSRQGVRDVNKRRDKDKSSRASLSSRSQTRIGRSRSETRTPTRHRLSPGPMDDSMLPGRRSHIRAAWQLAPVPVAVIDLEKKNPGLWDGFLTMIPKIRFFSFLTDGAIVEALSRLKPVSYEAGQVVFGHPTPPCDGSVYIVITGAFNVASRVTRSTTGDSHEDDGTPHQDEEDAWKEASTKTLTCSCTAGHLLTPMTVLLAAHVNTEVQSIRNTQKPSKAGLAGPCEQLRCVAETAGVLFKLDVEDLAELSSHFPDITKRSMTYLVNRLHVSGMLTAVNVFGLGPQIVTTESSLPNHVQELLSSLPININMQQRPREQQQQQEPPPPPPQQQQEYLPESVAQSELPAMELNPTPSGILKTEGGVPKDDHEVLYAKRAWQTASDPGLYISDQDARDSAAYLMAAHMKVPDGMSRALEDLRSNGLVIRASPGHRLIQAWKRDPPPDQPLMYAVLSGEVVVMVDGHTLFTATQGHLVGKLQVVAGDNQATDAWCRTSCVLVGCTRKWLDQLGSDHSSIRASVITSLVEHLSPLAMMLDFALVHITVPPGTVVCEQGSMADAMFVVVTGRLRCVRRLRGADDDEVEEDGKRKVADIGRGETVGDFELFTGSSYDMTASAVRSTVVIRISREMLAQIHAIYPHSTAHFCARAAATHVARLTGTTQQDRSRYNHHHQSQAMGTPEQWSSPSLMPSLSPLRRKSSFGMGADERRRRRKGLQVSTIAVLPASVNVPISAFASALESSLNDIAPAMSLDAAGADAALGPGYLEASDMRQAQLAGWLAGCEQDKDLVMYQGEASIGVTPWTHVCIGQADCVVVVVTEDELHVDSHLELALETAWEERSVKVHLVILHKTASPYRTNDDGGRVEDSSGDKPRRRGGRGRAITRFLKGAGRGLRRGLPGRRKWEKWGYAQEDHRGWLHGTTHIYGAGGQDPGETNAQDEVSLSEVDMRRLSRRLAGVSVGLVLGGGGARGLAHLGVIRALEEKGVPVDMVGGTSIGAFVGGLYAMHGHDKRTMDRTGRQFSAEMSSVVAKLLDLTIPITSWFTGRGFNRGIHDIFGDTLIQDLPLDYFCISTDIKQNEMAVHSSGPLWRYCRASMSLQGYLPPICDDDGSLLLDGGYMNNLPTDVMRQRGAQTVIAVDVSAGPVTDYTNYGGHLSGWQVLWNKLNPFAESWQVPSMADVSAALSYMSEYEKREKTLAEADLYLVPPVQEYGTLQFDAYDEIEKKGYDYAVSHLDEWLNEGAPGDE